MTFHQKLSSYTLGFLTDKDLPDIAITGLEEGFDSPSLRILAGNESNENPFVLYDCFKLAVAELGLELKDPREALIQVICFYAKRITDQQINTYTGFDQLNSLINKTRFQCQDLELMPCYVDYITIWEEKGGGLDFHTVEGLTRDQYIERTGHKIRDYLKNWLIVQGG